MEGYSGVYRIGKAIVHWKRPTPEEMSDEERARLKQNFADTALELMLKCKKREIEKGNGDKLEELGLGGLPDV